MHTWMVYDCFKFRTQTFFNDLDIGAYIFQENVPIETFNVSFESMQNKQQYGTKINGIKTRKKLWWLEM